MRWVKALHSVGVKARAGPWGFLLSRTATSPGMLVATSTQLPPSAPLWELYFQSALEKSTPVKPRDSIGLALP
jgi:hypothetical protein